MREIARGLSGEIRWSQSRKSTGPHQTKSRNNSFGSTWNTIVYNAPVDTPTNLIDLDIKAFLDDAVRRGWIETTDYLVSIEFGTEVGRGKGTTTVSSMRIN